MQAGDPIRQALVFARIIVKEMSSTEKHLLPEARVEIHLPLHQQGGRVPSQIGEGRVLIIGCLQVVPSEVQVILGQLVLAGVGLEVVVVRGNAQALGIDRGLLKLTCL